MLYMLTFMDSLGRVIVATEIECASDARAVAAAVERLNDDPEFASVTIRTSGDAVARFERRPH